MYVCKMNECVDLRVIDWCVREVESTVMLEVIDVRDACIVSECHVLAISAERSSCDKLELRFKIGPILEDIKGGQMHEADGVFLPLRRGEQDLARPVERERIDGCGEILDLFNRFFPNHVRRTIVRVQINDSLRRGCRNVIPIGRHTNHIDCGRSLVLRDVENDSFREIPLVDFAVLPCRKQVLRIEGKRDGRAWLVHLKLEQELFRLRIQHHNISGFAEHRQIEFVGRYHEILNLLFESLREQVRGNLFNLVRNQIIAEQMLLHSARENLMLRRQETRTQHRHALQVQLFQQLHIISERRTILPNRIDLHQLVQAGREENRIVRMETNRLNHRVVLRLDRRLPDTLDVNNVIQ